MKSKTTRARLKEIYEGVTARGDYNELFTRWLREESGGTPGFPDLSSALVETEPVVATDAIRAMLAAASVEHEVSMRTQSVRMAKTYFDRCHADELVDSTKLLARAAGQARQIGEAASRFSLAVHGEWPGDPSGHALDCLSGLLSRPSPEAARSADIIVRWASLVLATPAAAVLAGIGLDLGGRADSPHPSNGIVFLSFDPVAVWGLHTAALTAAREAAT